MIRTVLKIDGMMCGMCEAHLNDLIRKTSSIKKVSSSAKKGETIVISEQELNIPEIEHEIENIGYKLITSYSEPYEKKSSIFRK